jgi:hypothetical protein
MGQRTEIRLRNLRLKTQYGRAVKSLVKAGLLESPKERDFSVVPLEVATGLERSRNRTPEGVQPEREVITRSVVQMQHTSSP